MFRIDCPVCGKRNVSEFRYGGELTQRPDGEDQRAWAHYLYMRKNEAGVVREWWYHRQGCQSWFQVERDSRNNKVLAAGVKL